jgi:uncharacterized membrane protein YfcA
VPAEVLIAALVLFAAFTQGAIGFGFGLLVMAFLPRLLTLQGAVATTAVFGLFVSGTLVWRYRRAVDWRTSGMLLLAGVVGLPLGVLALREVDPDPGTRALGAILAAYALWELLARRAQAERPPIHRAWGWPAGFFAGLIGGAFAMGGPPVIVYATARRYPPIAFRAVLQGFFFPSTVIHVGNLWAADVLTPDIALRALYFVPLVPLGAWLGARFGDRLHAGVFRVVVLIALLVLGASYAWMGR